MILNTTSPTKPFDTFFLLTQYPAKAISILRMIYTRLIHSSNQNCFVVI